MIDIDAWQLMGSVASIAFSLGFVDQLRVTWKTKNVEGVSLLQWCVFASASAIFAAYYGHLDQWLMLSVSVFGTICCFAVVVMIVHYKKDTI